MTLLICNEDNQASFRHTLKKHAPEAYALACALYELGMIDGLRHTLLAPVPPGLPSRGAVPITLSIASEQKLIEREWARKGRK